jgi:hypothetical protein
VALTTLLDKITGEDSFRKWNIEKKLFGGKFLVSLFETIAIGIGFNSFDKTLKLETLGEKIKSLWSKDEFMSKIGQGTVAGTRTKSLIEFGRRYFRND